MRKGLWILPALWASVAYAETAKLPIAADMGICAHPDEVHLNTGARPVVRVKGNEHYYLFRFDTQPLAHWKVTSAALHLKLAAGHLRKVAFCTVPAEWVEGTGANDPQKGSTCFTHIRYPDLAWTNYGGTMLDATFNSPRMLWRTADVEYDGPWMKVPIAPELVQACAEGLSHGLVMSDEKGQTRENHDVCTREQAGAQPYVTVEYEKAPAPLTPLPAPPRQGPRAAAPVPTAPKLPELQTMPSLVAGQGGWRIQLLPATSNQSVQGASGRAASAIPVPLAPRNAWVGLQAVIVPPTGQADDVTVAAAPLVFFGVRKEPAPPLRIVRPSRVWCVPDKDRQYHAEVLVPLKAGERFGIPWQRNGVPGQDRQAIFVDVWVPKDAAPGPYQGKLVVSQDGKPVAEAPFKIDVSAVTLGDEFRVVGDCNTYDSPAGAMGVREEDAQAFLAMERNYYRLAHEHRMTLNVLPYSQSGSINWRGAPQIAGSGKDCKVSDWKDWDERYGPLLSGQAFSKDAGYVGPGEDLPIHHMYLPFHENWPEKLAEHFKPWPPPKDYQKFLTWTAELPAIESCFDDQYHAGWIAVEQQFLRHLEERQWTGTVFQVYLNNKYYFREKGGRGISLWLLDEPMFGDDFLALRYFAKLSAAAGGRGQAPKAANVSLRVDLSRPTHQRNWLDALVGLNVCPDQLYSQRHWFADRKEKLGEEYWNYAMPPSFAADNVGWAAWPVRSLCWGATGTLPWQTIGSDGDLLQADETALMYPAREFSLDGPIPSLRMKAWRQGLQDAELLRILKEKMKWSDVQLRAWVGQALGLDGWRDGMEAREDAPIVTFGGITQDKLDLLRATAIQALDER